MTFINRRKELNQLETLWDMHRSQLVILYGKRRVGKTELIKQFISTKPSIYYLADKRTHHDQLIELGRRVRKFFSDSMVERTGFQSWIDLFDYIKGRTTSPFVLAIDEYPYLTESDATTGSLFQKGWDEYLKDSPIYLILCGSSISMMEQETLIHTSPLFGRRTADFLIEPMMAQDSRYFFKPDVSFTTFMEFYTLTGGMPAYLTHFSTYSDRMKAISHLVLDKSGLFYREVEFLLKEETREPKTYLSILSAIALGSHKFGEISTKTGLEKHILTKYLGTLISLLFVKRESPVTEKHPEKSKKSVYFLSDLFFRLWFRYVFPNKSELELGFISPVLDELASSIVHLESYAYEDVCKQWVQHNSLSSFRPQKIGRWWSASSEIDIVALNSRENSILFGEVKWTSEKVGIDILNRLIDKSQQVEWGLENRREYFILFSKSGFTDAVLAESAKGRVYLVEGDRLLG